MSQVWLVSNAWGRSPTDLPPTAKRGSLAERVKAQPKSTLVIVAAATALKPVSATCLQSGDSLGDREAAHFARCSPARTHVCRATAEVGFRLVIAQARL